MRRLALGAALALAALAATFALRAWLASGGAGTWPHRAAAPQPVARWGSATAVVGGRLLVFGGWTGTDLRASLRADAYDPRTDRWTALRDLPEPLTHVAPVVDGDTLWFVGGFLGDKAVAVTTATVWRYSVADDAWSPGPPLPEARAGGGAVRLGRTLHYYGGFGPDGRTASGSHFALALDDPAARWSGRAPLPSPRGHLSGVALRGLACAIGGEDRHDGTDVDDVHAYDARRDAWRRLARLPAPRSHVEASTVVADGRIVLMGGRDNATWAPVLRLAHGKFSALRPGLLRTLWRLPQGAPRDRWAARSVIAYDVARDRWSPLPGLPWPLLAPTARIVGDEVVLTGGSLLGWRAPQMATWIGPVPGKRPRR